MKSPTARDPTLPCSRKLEVIISMVEIVTKEGSVRDIDFVSVKIYLSGIDEKVVNTHISRAEEVVQDCLKISREKVRVSVEYGSG